MNNMRSYEHSNHNMGYRGGKKWLESKVNAYLAKADDGFHDRLGSQNILQELIDEGYQEEADHLFKSNPFPNE